MTPSLRNIVEAISTEFERQLAEDRAKPWDEGGHIKAADASRVFAPGEPADGQVSNIYLMGRFDLAKVAQAALGAIPAEELAVAISAALDPDDFYVFGTTPGVEPGARENITSIGIDGIGDLVETAQRTLRALTIGVEWKAGSDGVLVAHVPEATPAELP